MSEEKNIALMGLPETGKTSFLAALWHVVESSELDSSFLCKKIQGDRRYLEEIRGKWLKCEELERTKIPEDLISISILLEREEDNELVTLNIPDLAGEIFNKHFEERSCSIGFNEMMNSSSSLILFVNPMTLHQSQLISNVNKALGPVSGVIAETSEFQVRKLPCQVKLVDNLQLISFLKGRPIDKIAVVVSAWDTLGGMEPELFIENELKLLSQFLKNSGSHYKIFGLSALGGDYKNKEVLLEKNNPSDRIKLRYNEKTTSDVTKIIEWCLQE